MRSLPLALCSVITAALVGLAPAIVDAQSLTVTGTTTLPADTITTYTSVTVESGGTLDIGGGSVITVTSALTINAGGTVLCRTKNINAQVGGAWVGAGVTIHAGSVLIAATGILSADGQGYLNGIGPGFPTGLAASTAYRTGASHGGLGTGTGAMVGYGSSLQPVTPGTGAAFFDNEQTAGGGAIRLIVDGTLTLDGEITADGTGTTPALAVYHGGATGGSIWVTADVLTGAGIFTADARKASYSTTADTPYGESGGGRIAIYARLATDFTSWATTTVNPGGGTAQTGSLFFAVGSPGAEAMRIPTRAEFPQDTIRTLQSLTLDPTATLEIGGGSSLTMSGALTLGDNATVVCRGKNTTAQVAGAWAGTGVSLRAASATIPATAKITADGQGYGRGAGPGYPVGMTYSTGGSFGGKASGTGAVAAYGSSLRPIDLGSPGGQNDLGTVTGGGAIRLTIDGTLTLAGEITANGTGRAPGNGIAHGGATGGSIWVTAHTLVGAGKFTANAMRSVFSNGYVSSSGNSSGGRIAIYTQSATGYTGFANITADAGNTVAEPGTIVLLDTSVADGGALRVTQRLTLQAESGPIASFGTVSVENGATLEVAGGVALDVAGTLSVTGNSTLLMRSKDQTAMVNGGWAGSGALIVADTIIVAAGSKISADGEGYRNGAGPGIPIGLPTTTAFRTGASYGGRGTGPGALLPYGTPLEPIALGTGAAISDNEQTAGGGALRIIVDGTLMLDGEITADGVGTAPGFQVGHGGATGGSIWVTTSALSGTGKFTADAMPAVLINGYPTTGHSSGGRVAVYYQAAAGFSGFSTSSASALNGDAEQGTVLFINANGDALETRCFTRLDVLEGQSLALQSLALEAGAVLDLYGGSTLNIAGLLDFRENVVVNFLSRNRTAPFNGVWIGEGARINAGEMRIAASAVLTANSQGYLNAGGPGGPNALQTQTTGGSYGGRGSGTAAAASYGSLIAPRDLGSAGGYGQNGAHQNTSNVAGGAVFLYVDRSLQFDGTITAVGSAQDTLHAGATGGSILVRANSLSGTGRMIADGLPGYDPNSSSGGRIAIWAETNTFPAGLVSAAAGGPGAQAGTIYYADATDIAWIKSPVEIFSGPTRLDWITTSGGSTSVGVDLLAQPATGAATTLATGLAANSDFLWDTTTFDDGAYTLTVRKRNTRTGEILGSDTRTVTVLNDGLILRGVLTGNVTIPAGKVSYVLGEVTIPAGVTVTIEPGAIAKVSLGGSFLAQTGGTLTALGTDVAPIILTSMVDDTAGGDSNFDGASTTPGVADWLGLRSTGGTYQLNEHTELRHAVEIVGGDITTTVRWRAGSIHLIERVLDIVGAGHLTIEAGAIVKVASSTAFERKGLRVLSGGTLTTEGTLLRPVIFTSEHDDSVGGDTNGDGSLRPPVAGDWYGIYFEDTTTSSLRHTHFYYGGASAASFRSLCDVHTATVRFESCVFVDTLFEVIYLQPDEGGSVTLENCIITRAGRGIYAARGSTAVVRNCVFDGVGRALHYDGGRIDVTNSAITNSLNWGVLVESGSVVTDFVANAFWNPRASGGNSSVPAIVVGQNGVLSGDPKFFDRAALDFRVLAGSALIDAGNAAVAVATDHRGFARLGTAPEIGALEFTEPYASPIDLQAEVTVPPSTAVSGSTADLTIAVRNTGTGAVTGPWRHTIFLRSTAGGADVFVAEFVDQPAAVLAPGGAISFTLTVPVPEGLIGLHQWGVTVNGREDLFEGANLANNTVVASAVTLLDVPELPFGGIVSGRFSRAGESRVFKVRAADPGQTIHLLVDTDATRGFTQLFAARGRVPAADDFDAQSPQWDLPDATLSLANSVDDWYYVRVTATEMRVASTAFTLAARSVEFQLSGLGLAVVGTAPVTIPVFGTDLRNGVTVSLRPVGGTSSIAAGGVTVTGGVSADATFDLTNATPGTYDVVVTQGGIERVLPGQLRVSSAAAGAKIITTVAGPGTNRVGFPYFAAITARNVGAADSPTPIITITGPGLPVDLNDPDSPFYGYGFGAGSDVARDFYFAIPPTGNPAILPAGRSAEEFIAQGLTPERGFRVDTNIVQVGDSTPYDLAGFGIYLAPDPKPAGWDDAWAMLAGSVPQTLGGLAHLVNTAADGLYRQSGFRSNNVVTILSNFVEYIRRVAMSRVQGRVHWLAETEQTPLSGITLRLIRADNTIAASATTSAAGTFAFETVLTGTYDWEIAGAFPAAVYAPLTVGIGDTLSGIDLAVVTGASAFARLLPISGVAFEDMEVSLTDLDRGLQSTARADALGNVTLRGLLDGNYTLRASAPGRPPVTRENVSITFGRLNDLGTVAFALQTGVIKGRVIRADTLAAVAGATVSVVESGGPVIRTDANGDYILDPVADGTWTVRVRATGFALLNVPAVLVTSGTESIVNPSLPRGGTISGVVSSTGTAIQGAAVNLFSGTQLLASTLSNASGQFTLADLAAGSFSIEAVSGGYGQVTTAVDVVAATDQTVNLALVAPASVTTGSVRYTGGTLAGQHGIRITGLPGGNEYTSTNSDGTFSQRGLPVGSYVWSLADGGLRRAFTVAADGIATPSLDVTAPAGEITGRIVAADGTTPAVATVHLVTAGQRVATTASNTQGEYRFSLVAPGSYEVHPYGVDRFYAKAANVVVLAGQPTLVPTLAEGTSTLEVVLTDSASGSVPTGFAMAFLEPLDPPRGVKVLQIGQVDARGIALFQGLASGEYRVSAIGLGTATDLTTVTVVSGAHQKRLTLAPAGYIDGRLTDSSSSPVEGLEVIAFRASDLSRQWRSRVASDGTYSISALLPGDYVLQVVDRRDSTAPALTMPAPQTITISAGTGTTRDFTLTANTTTLTGAVAAVDGSYPFSGEVALVSSAGLEVVRRTITDTAQYSLPAPLAGNYTLRYSGLGFVGVDKAVTVASASIVTPLDVTWTGGASQLSYTRLSPLRAPGTGPTMAADLGGLVDWVWQCKESYRKMLEDLLKKPVDRTPFHPFPQEFRDPCLSCPDALGWWREYLRRNRTTTEAFDSWHKSWEAQIEIVAAEVGLLGVNLLKLVNIMVSAQIESAVLVKAVGEELPELVNLTAKLSRTPHLDTELFQWAVQRQEDLMVIQDRLNQLFNLGVAGGAVGQVDWSGGNGPKFWDTLAKLGNPSTYSSSESVYGAISDCAGIIKAVADLASLSNKAREAFGKSAFGKGFDGLFKALDKIFTTVDTVLSVYKVFEASIKTQLQIDQSKELYERALASSEEAYGYMIASLPYCECSGGEECACEPPPDPPPGPRPPKPPGGRGSGSGNGNGDEAHDPNAKYTIGYGDVGYVRPDEPLIYTVTFENIATAGLPAQRVIVTDQLAANLDWATFELLAFGFNRTAVAVPSGLQRFTTRVNVDTDPNPVKCDLRLNPATGLFTIDLRSVDAVTGGFPRNSLSGFLPPNDAQHRGEGFVTFKIHPKPGLADLAQIHNLASIVFDTNDAIVTNETVNTIDATPPDARVSALPDRSGGAFQVSWAAAASLGSDVLGYSVWVSRNGGAWEIWQNDVATTTALFTGERGVRYRFFASARDAVGWSDAITFSAQANTNIIGDARLINISTRGLNGTGADAMIVGFVVRPGTNPATTKNILIRGAGPTLGLAPFNLGGVLGDPRLDLYNSAGNIVLDNDDWGLAPNAAQMPGAYARLFAFAFPSDSKDAAVLTALAPATYTARVTGAGAETGIMLIEAYDADSTFSDPALPQIINLSTRGFVGTGDQVMIAGFVITGSTAKTLLIRAVGETLGTYGVPGTVADPEIRLVNAAGATIATNDNWSDVNPPLIESVGTAVGAFPLPPGSRDAALVLTLNPGLYTVIVSGKGSTTGVVLTELYDADP